MGEQFFKLPSIVKAFAVTIPSGTFEPGSGAFVLGILEFKAHYIFSQRRTDINDLVEGIVSVREEDARADERDKIKKDLAKKLGDDETPE